MKTMEAKIVVYVGVDGEVEADEIALNIEELLHKANTNYSVEVTDVYECD